MGSLKKWFSKLKQKYQEMQFNRLINNINKYITNCALMGYTNLEVVIHNEEDKQKIIDYYVEHNFVIIRSLFNDSFFISWEN